MKKLALRTSSLLAAFGAFATNTFAQGSAILTGSDKPIAAASGTLGQNITLLINYFLGILGLIAVGFLIYSGVLMVTAGGDEQQISKARKIITYAVIGIVIILLSWTIVTFVASALG